MSLAIDFVTRVEWGARPPDFVNLVDEMPTPQLWLHHSAGSGTDETAMRAIQDFHMDVRGWSDFAYSYALDDDSPDIDIFVGRGAGVRGSHTACCNEISHAICIIGNYTDKAPTDKTLEQLSLLVAYGYQEGWWPLGFTGGHRDSPGAATTCPGDALWALIPSINARAVEIYEESLMPTVEEIVAGVREDLNANGVLLSPGENNGGFIRNQVWLKAPAGTAATGAMKTDVKGLVTDVASLNAKMLTAQNTLNAILTAVQGIDNSDNSALLAKIDTANAHLVAIRDGLGAAGL